MQMMVQVYPSRAAEETVALWEVLTAGPAKTTLEHTQPHTHAQRHTCALEIRPADLTSATEGFDRSVL